MVRDSLHEWINPAYHNPAALARRYKAEKPFPHLSLQKFLVEKKAQALLLAVRKQQFTHKASDLFSLFQTMDLTASKDKTISSFARFLRSKEFSQYMRTVTGVKLTNKSLDLAGALYADTDYLLCHDDQLTGRKIAYILYLCPPFTAKDGGALALLADKRGAPGAVVKRLYPSWNTLNFFTVSKKSWHAVEEVIGDNQRLSIGGWLH